MHKTLSEENENLFLSNNIPFPTQSYVLKYILAQKSPNLSPLSCWIYFTLVKQNHKISLYQSVKIKITSVNIPFYEYITSNMALKQKRFLPYITKVSYQKTRKYRKLYRNMWKEDMENMKVTGNYRKIYHVKARESWQNSLSSILVISKMFVWSNETLIIVL